MTEHECYYETFLRCIQRIQTKALTVCPLIVIFLKYKVPHEVPRYVI